MIAEARKGGNEDFLKDLEYALDRLPQDKVLDFVKALTAQGQSNQNSGDELLSHAKSHAHKVAQEMFNQSEQWDYSHLNASTFQDSDLVVN